MTDPKSLTDEWFSLLATGWKQSERLPQTPNPAMASLFREVAAAALEWAESTVPHEPGCPTICDDESDYEFLSDAGECVCQRRVFVETMRAKAKEIRDGA